MRAIALILSMVFVQQLVAQKPLGHEQAIPSDSIIFVSWATSCTLQRGYQDISNESLGYTTVGDESAAIGPATENGIVSLGDGGMATLLFNQFIINGPGPDFAVFENGFPIVGDSTFYLELAFVEVSSDGSRFVRFPSSCLNDTLVQKDNATGTDPRNITNLAGKYIYGYGTPFDLDELKDSSGIDLHHITHIRIIDVVGALSNAYARRDSYGHKINDPWPTPFPSCGFDLDAVGVIHQSNATGFPEVRDMVQSIYPNPAAKDQLLSIRLKQDNKGLIVIHDLAGKKVLEKAYSGKQPEIDLNGLVSGMYILQVTTMQGSHAQKLWIK